MAFMALPVIPNLKITDRHLIDTKNMEIIHQNGYETTL
jgi:adenine deaminase